MKEYEITYGSSSGVRFFRFGNGSKKMVIFPGLSLKDLMSAGPAVAAAYNVFGEEYTVYLFERPDDMKEGDTVRDIAHKTAEAMDAEGIEEAYVFSASTGGMIAQCLAVIRPDLVKCMILASTTSRMTAENDAGIGKWVSAASEGRLDELGEMFLENVYSEQTVRLYRMIILDGMKDPSEDEIRRFTVLAHAIEGFDISGELSEIKCPVLVTGGSCDKVLGNPFSLTVEGTGALLRIYEGYGHAVYDEIPEFKDMIKEFFDNDGRSLS